MRVAPASDESNLNDITEAEPSRNNQEAVSGADKDNIHGVFRTVSEKLVSLSSRNSEDREGGKSSSGQPLP